MPSSGDLSVDMVASRYRELRTLRTRATGTPFRVVYRSGELIVIPTSGIERIVTRDELRRTWPLINAGATRTALKQVSSNSSYLEAVFDDLSSELEPRLPTQVVTADAPLAPLPTDEIDGLKNRLSKAKAQAHDLRDRLNRADDRIAELERHRVAATSSGDELESTIIRLRRELLTLRTGKARAEMDVVAAREQIQAMESRDKQTSRELTLKIDGHVFDSQHPIPADLWDILYEAGQLTFKFPSASVAASRRAMESAVGRIWRQATGGVGTPKVADMLNDLRGHRLMPDPDWHLAKNIYGRASGIVHDGTNRADLALWIFFGSVQICELVQPE